MIFQEKYFSRDNLSRWSSPILTDQISLPLLLEVLSIMCIVIFFSDGNAINFEIKLSFLVKWTSKTRVTGSNSRVTSSNPRVTSSNLGVTSSNPRVRALKARFGRLKLRVGRLKARVTR